MPSIRTVNIEAGAGTTVTNDPTGDERTLFPIQAALGYDLTQTMFIGEQSLIVEGVSDFWYLSSVSEYLVEQNRDGLPAGVVLTPAGGAQKVSYMVALLTAQRLRVLVLLDNEPTADNAMKEMLRSSLLRTDAVLRVADAFGASAPQEADIEDLLDPGVFDQLVQNTYTAELAGRTLTINSHIPRIVKRYEEAFNSLGIDFHKTRPAKLFLRRVAEAPASVLPNPSLERFENLFKLVHQRFDAQERRGQQPFR